MSVGFFCRLAIGAPFHLDISLLCVECQWQETPDGQVSVTDMHVVATHLQILRPLGNKRRTFR